MDFQITSGLNALPMSVPGVFIPGPQPSSVRGGNNLTPTFGAEADVSSNVYSGRAYLIGITLPPADAHCAGEYIHRSKYFPSFVTFLIHILLKSSWCCDVSIESIP